MREDCTRGYEGKAGGKKRESIGDGQRGLALTQTLDGKRNRRSVWTVATRPYKGAHFATFPTELIEPCILAGSRKNDIVLDPFMGSGTTAQVAIQHGRQYLGCELNPTYKDLQDQRLQTQIKPKKVSAVERCEKTTDLFGIHG
jgi:DNA modification methylase